jgi:hypothetical protein
MRRTILPAVLLAAGCTPFQVEMPQTPPVDPGGVVPPGAAEVCVLRTRRGVGTQLVRDNGLLVGATQGRAYLCYRAHPGPHHVDIRAAEDQAAVDLLLAAGERVFLRPSPVLAEGGISRVPEGEARAELNGLPFQQLVSAPEPVLPPPALADAASGAPRAERPSSSAPEEPLRRRPGGIAYGFAAGLGVAATRIPPATETTPSFGALGSLWVGYAPADLVTLAVRVDLPFVAGVGRTDVALHVALYPAAYARGSVRDFMIFVDGGVRLPTASGSTTGDPQAGGAARLGLAWERWLVGPLQLGPFVSGEISRGGPEADGALLVGISASVYPKGARR